MVICWLTLDQSLLRRRRSIRFHFDYLGSLRLIARLFCCCCVVQFIRAEILSSDRHRDNLTVWHCTDQSRLLSCKMISILLFFSQSLYSLTALARSPVRTQILFFLIHRTNHTISYTFLSSVSSARSAHQQIGRNEIKKRRNEFKKNCFNELKSRPYVA